LDSGQGYDFENGINENESEDRKKKRLEGGRTKIPKMVIEI